MDWSEIQRDVRNTLVEFGAVPVTVRLLNNTTITTIGIFLNSLAKNIDTLQNPTSLTGETSRFVVVPGIDFFSSGATTTPQVTGTVEWTINSVLYKKVISSVAMEMPIPNVPILFTLGIE